jgi:hypothetical protein
VGGVLQQLSRAMSDIRAMSSHLPVELAQFRTDFVAFSAMWLGPYAFARAWWKGLKRSGAVGNAYFLAMSPLVWAASAEGIRTVLLQHGLISKDLMIPPVDEIHPLTHYEASYFRRLVPTAVIAPVRAMTNGEGPRRKIALIVSGSTPKDQSDLVLPMVMAFLRMGLAVHVRPFKGENLETFWRSDSMVPDIAIEGDAESFGQLLGRLRPVFVAAPGSTALVDALYGGIIPICVASDDDTGVTDTVFPLRQCSLSWPSDSAAIEDVLTSDERYSSRLGLLRAVDIAGLID